jgi:hypothetical protein
LRQGKKVFFIALEAYENEIEDRILYQYCAQRFFKDPYPGNNSESVRFDNWRKGKNEALTEYESDFVNEGMHLENLFTYYKGLSFGIKQLTMAFEEASVNKADVILLDHIHYFDLETTNENLALREITRHARSLSQIKNIPLVMVGHLRKTDKNLKELCPDEEEFHGSSDLYKIATKVVTVAAGGSKNPNEYLTYIRAPKGRGQGGLRGYIARLVYVLNQGDYKPGYELGVQYNAKEGALFKPLMPDKKPDWAKRAIFEGHVAAPPRPPSRVDHYGKQRYLYE